MDEDTDKTRQVKAHEVGMPLDALSISELEARIALLEGEISRLREAIGRKAQSRSAADAAFKF